MKHDKGESARGDDEESKLHRQLQEDQAGIIAELELVGIRVGSVYDLIADRRNSRIGLAVLLDHLSKPHDRRILQGILYAIDCARDPKAWEVLLGAFKRFREKGEHLYLNACWLDALVASYSSAREQQALELAGLTDLGFHRLPLVYLLRKSTHPNVVAMFDDFSADSDWSRHVRWARADRFPVPYRYLASGEKRKKP